MACVGPVVVVAGGLCVALIYGGGLWWTCVVRGSGLSGVVAFVEGVWCVPKTMW